MMGELYTLNNLWTIRPGLNRISGKEADLTIPPKYMEVLMYLIGNAGEVVSRDELLSAIWIDTVVVEESLTRAVSELRKILGDDPREPKIIETIPKKGYRLIAEVDRRDRSAPEPPPEEKRPAFARLHPVFFGVLTIMAAAVLFLTITLLRNKKVSGPPVRLMPLTSYPGEESHPALSPDGNRLAFRWNGDGGYNYNIYIKVIGSETPLQLTYDGFTTEPAWSPDGRYISYIKNTSRGRAVYMVPSSSGPEQRIAPNCYHARNPVWSPDGSHLIYGKFVREQGSQLIHLYSLSTQEETVISGSGGRPVFDSKPVFSPAGERIAFIRTLGGIKDVFTLSPDGSNLKQLTQGGQWITGVDWSPDGRWVIYSTKEGVWKISESGGRAHLLTAGGLRIDNISTARNSWRLAYDQSSREENIWKLIIPEDKTPPAEPKRHISSSRSDREPVFSPDGRHIAFISDRTGAPQLWICRRDGSNLVQLTHFNGCIVTYPRWSPDGSKITFTAQLHGNSDIFSVNAEGGEPIQITRNHSREITSSWSRDGTFLYFTSNRNDNKMQIWKTPADGGEAVLVNSSGGYRPTESPDGKTLYYEKIEPAGQGIWEKPVSGGREKRLFILPASWILDWTLTGEGIYFAHRDTSRSFEIGYYDSETTVRSVLFRTDSPANNFSFDPESRTALFSQIERDEGDIVLMENFQ